MEQPYHKVTGCLTPFMKDYTTAFAWNNNFPTVRITFQQPSKFVRDARTN
jgi:hypothetical protein